MRTTRVLLVFLVSLFLFTQWHEISYGDGSVLTGRDFLIDKHHTIEKKLEKSPSDVPFYIESSVSKNASLVDIYGTIHYPFGIIKNEFLVPTNWCEILLPTAV